MTLTISAKPETILGVMRKLNICNAKFSVNKGYSVVLDECEVAAKKPKKKTKKKK